MNERTKMPRTARPDDTATRRRTLYAPTWWERRIPWMLDALALLDPAPLDRRWHRITAPARSGLGIVCQPLAAVIAGAGAAYRAAVTRCIDTATEALRLLPLPSLVKSWLWLGPVSLRDPSRDSAQLVLRRQSAVVLPVSLIVAVIAHAAVIVYGPELEAADVSITTDELIAVEIPPYVEVPPPPQRIARPSTPVIATTDVDEAITIAPTTFDHFTAKDELPPPPEIEEVVEEEGPTFTPFTVAPQLRDRNEVARLMREYYPERLRDVGVGGAVSVWAFIDEEGDVTETRIATSSGVGSLDDAALRVVDEIRFSPAIDRDQKVAVWIQLPLEFEVR